MTAKKTTGRAMLTTDEIAALIDLCRAKGVQQIAFGDVTLVLGPPPVDISALPPVNHEPQFQQAELQMTPDERWEASGLAPAIDYRDRFKGDDD